MQVSHIRALYAECCGKVQQMSQSRSVFLGSFEVHFTNVISVEAQFTMIFFVIMPMLAIWTLPAALANLATMDELALVSNSLTNVAKASKSTCTSSPLGHQIFYLAF